MRSLPQPTIPAADGLTIRPWQTDDRDVVFAAFADNDISHWHPSTPDDPGAWIEQWPQQWAEATAASWAVVAGEEVLGQIGLRNVRLARSIGSVSYWMLPTARRRGAASAALIAMTDWVFSELELHRLELGHSVGNPNSCRVAERTGYLFEGIRRSSALHADGWHDMHLHARINGD